MRHSLFQPGFPNNAAGITHAIHATPDFAPRFDGGVGSVALTPVDPLLRSADKPLAEAVPVNPVPGPIDKEIRRINSAHQPEVREVASDNEIGRDIVDEDARRLAAQQRSVRRQERARRATTGEGESS